MKHTSWNCNEGCCYTVERDSPEWHRMWSVLAGMQPDNWKGDTACVHPECGEVWQYTGTYQGNHEFRHRYHPCADKRLVWWVRAAAR